MKHLLKYNNQTSLLTMVQNMYNQIMINISNSSKNANSNQNRDVILHLHFLKWKEPTSKTHKHQVKSQLSKQYYPTGLMAMMIETF